MGEAIDVKEPCKILFLGDIGTGKTSIIKRFLGGVFSIGYRSTIGVDFAKGVIKRESDTTDINLIMWDIAGPERYGNLTHIYYKDALAAFIVFDVTRLNTLAAAKIWKTDLDEKLMKTNNKHFPVILLANKIDLLDEEKRAKLKEDIDIFYHEYGFLAWFEISAKDNYGIDPAFQRMSEEL